MADRFFDTSAVVKHYRAETGTAAVDALLASSGTRHVISTLSVVEFHSVLARLVRTGHAGITDFHRARGRFLADIAAGLWHVEPLSDADFHHAQQLLVKHGLAHGLRTLDAIQLAVALRVHASTTLHAFVCADVNLCQVARPEGLVVVNPEIP